MGQVVGVQLLDVVSDVRGFPSWYSWKRVTTRCCGLASPEPRNPLPASNQEYVSGNPLSGGSRAAGLTKPLMLWRDGSMPAATELGAVGAPRTQDGADLRPVGSVDAQADLC